MILANIAEFSLSIKTLISSRVELSLSAPEKPEVSPTIKMPTSSTVKVSLSSPDKPEVNLAFNLITIDIFQEGA